MQLSETNKADNNTEERQVLRCLVIKTKNCHTLEEHFQRITVT